MGCSVKGVANPFSLLLARLAGAAVEHGINAAGVLFLGSERFGFGGGSHDAAGFLFDVDRAFLDVGGFESVSPD